MDKFNATKIAAANQAIRATQAEPQSGEARPEVQNLDDWQLVLVGGGDNTPNW